MIATSPKFPDDCQMRLPLWVLPLVLCHSDERLLTLIADR